MKLKRIFGTVFALLIAVSVFMIPASAQVNYVPCGTCGGQLDNIGYVYVYGSSSYTDACSYGSRHIHYINTARYHKLTCPKDGYWLRGDYDKTGTFCQAKGGLL